MNPALLLEQLLGSTHAQSVTNAVIFVLFLVFAFSVFSARRGINASLVQHAPNLLTSIGILGTFIGIVIGLLGFDTADIDGSIGPLLDGLKTAFITSLVGMAFAILFKSLDSVGWISPKAVEEEVGAATPEKILSSLLRQESAMLKLTQSIAGDDEGTLTGQIRLMRSSQADHQRSLLDKIDRSDGAFAEFQTKLWSELESVAEMLSKSATEQVINALKDVITDFNNNLTEQFGDNFKRLDESVKKLVDWQAEYKVQMEQMMEQYQTGVSAITSTQELVQHIERDASKIPATMESLRALLEVIDVQISELDRHLEGFRDMRDRAVEAMPEIQKHVDSMLQEVSAAAAESTERVSEVTDAMKKALITGVEDFQNSVSRTNEGLVTASDTLANRSTEISEQLTESVQEINTRMRDLMGIIEEGHQSIESELDDSAKRIHDRTEQVHDTLAASFETMKKQVERSLEGFAQEYSKAAAGTGDALSQRLEEAVQETGKAATAQINAINRGLEQELERVMTNMGKALAQIAEKFTQDYSQLTSQMQQIVDQSKKFR